MRNTAAHVVAAFILVVALAGCAEPGEGSGGGGTPIQPGGDTAAGGDTAGGVDSAGGDTVGSSCQAVLGPATLTGVVDGQALTATHGGAAEISLMGLQGYWIMFGNVSGTCASAISAANSGTLLIQLCDLTPGQYDLDHSCIPEGGGIALSTSVSLPREGDDVDATSATITITSFDPACGGRVVGTLTADFDGAAVTGTFDTVSCGLVEL